MAIKKGVNYLNNLSPQQIVDCSSPFGNDGCSGGQASRAFSYIARYGLTYASLYPYRNSAGSCRVSSVSVLHKLVAIWFHGHSLGLLSVTLHCPSCALQATIATWQCAVRLLSLLLDCAGAP